VLSDAFLFKLAEGAAAAACTLEEVFFLVLAGADVALDGDVTDGRCFFMTGQATTTAARVLKGDSIAGSRDSSRGSRGRASGGNGTRLAFVRLMLV